MFCTRCGTNNHDTDQFCKFCSAQLKTSAAQGQSSQSGPGQYPYSTPQQQSPSQPQSQSQSQQGQYSNYSNNPNYGNYPQQDYGAYSATPPQQYGYANQYSQQNQGASGRAIASLVLSILSLFTCGPILSIPGLILGKMELNAIRQGTAPRAGEGFAKAGFYVGIVATLLVCLVATGYILMFIIGIGSLSLGR